MRKLTPEERLKHGVIVLLKKEDYEDLKRFAEETNASQAAWARKLVLQGLQRQRRIEKTAKDTAAEREAAQQAEEAAAREAADALKAAEAIKEAATKKKTATKAAPKKATAKDATAKTAAKPGKAKPKK